MCHAVPTGKWKLPSTKRDILKGKLIAELNAENWRFWKFVGSVCQWVM